MGGSRALDLKSTVADGSIPVYWREAALFSPPKPIMPDRQYVVVGYVTGDAHPLSQGFRFELVEEQFRRGATALRGDAVIDARPTHYYGPSPVTAFEATVVRWKRDNERAAVEPTSRAFP